MNCHTRFRLHYIDDSGSADTGYTTFTWLALAPESWAAAQQQWLRFRADLYARHRIPPGARLHATDLTSGRSRPSLNPDFSVRTHGLTIVRDGLDVIAAIRGLTVGTVYRHGGHPSEAKRELYRALVNHLDGELHRTGHMGMIFMDGDGSDHRYAGAHRELHPDTRGLIEAPVFRSAEHDQWVQMADFAAWSAYQSILRKPTKRRFWNWYPRTLGPLDPHGPLAL
ncbi:hypothetical protein BDK92_2587 [Micromonospora pisi]|uniref:DUF3800 domain-containing protein n=1 Tax=Micromonospora pisi TaxID=589240 RepID=A0A495JI94_9ACTN|nr:DUF3800 domain-containing protein [Micromonospora pisi]RKR88278.1 hypothetical protein BDK92_2587 [Micromonospora pisi]